MIGANFMPKLIILKSKKLLTNQSLFVSSFTSSLSLFSE